MDTKIRCARPRQGWRESVGSATREYDPLLPAFSSPQAPTGFGTAKRKRGARRKETSRTDAGDARLGG